jgi:hypothetical protein
MKEIIKQVEALAMKEINEYKIPKTEHFILANEKGQQLAEALGANKDIVMFGTILMDLKIGMCMKEGRLAEHVQESASAAKEFLKNFNLADDDIKKIISCIELHHGTDKYPCLEAEICANADCYRFLSAEGFFHGLLIFGQRTADFNEVLNNLEKKIEEKHNVISLSICRQELEDNFQNFKKLIEAAKRN